MKGKAEKTFEIIRACVPKGTLEKLGRSMGNLTADTISRWRRAPEDDENPAGTGSLNPLDKIEILQDHAFAHAPAESHRIHLYLQRRWENHFSYREKKPLSVEERDRELADLVGEQAEMMRAVLQKLPADRIRKEWEELKREGEELVSAIEAGAA